MAGNDNPLSAAALRQLNRQFEEDTERRLLARTIRDAARIAQYAAWRHMGDRDRTAVNALRQVMFEIQGHW